MLLNSDQLTHFPSNLTRPSAIDLCLATNDIYLKCDWYPLESFHGSDHKPIIITIQIEFDTILHKPHKTNLNKVDWQKYRLHLTEIAASFPSLSEN